MVIKLRMIPTNMFNCSHKGLYMRLSFKPQLWSWSLYFITMVPLSERTADEYADAYFKAIYCHYCHVA